MGRIKSALEIALERTASVKSDKAGIGQFEAKQKGKKIANKFLDDSQKSLLEFIEESPAEERNAIKQGIFDTLVSQIVLPANKEDGKRVENVGKALSLIINNTQFNNLYKQFIQIIFQYFDEIDQYTHAIKQQFAPKLKQKEEEIAKRLGHNIKLDPFQDPEFVAFYNQHINALKQNYQGMIKEVREQTIAFFNKH